ncbi:Nucleotidyltransferase [Fistulina hepatica ATCC 64428]|uniref:DNA polymerase n=1 Tax=Fistulina hepatica ATCC 64428 TaxID=1128425 RepID=A0A0D7A7K2_9AGAR|nr:Nucleotidyltransferase [Fistulina hepatica ATCC 64428]
MFVWSSALRRFQPSLKYCTQRYLSDGPNAEILRILQQHREEAELEGKRNVFKIRAFKNAIASVQKLDYAITCPEDARKVSLKFSSLQSPNQAVSQIRGIGPGIMGRLENFFAAKSGSSSAKSVSDKSKFKPPSSPDLLEKETVMKTLTKLPHTNHSSPSVRRRLQRVAFLYVDHFDRGVTRSQIESVLKMMQDILTPQWKLIPCGSYRRGAELSSQIDLIVVHPQHVHVPLPNGPPAELTGGRSRMSRPFSDYYSYTAPERASSPLLTRLVPRLKHQALLVEEEVHRGMWRRQGVVLLPDDRWPDVYARREAIRKHEGNYARLDMTLVPPKSLGAATLSLTGDREFNKFIRKKAASLGYLLNDFGLWKWSVDWPDSPSNGQHVRHDPEGALEHGFWALQRTESEAEIFEALGLEYVEPTKRNFIFLTNATK